MGFLDRIKFAFGCGGRDEKKWYLLSYFYFYFI